MDSLNCAINVASVSYMKYIGVGKDAMLGMLPGVHDAKHVLH